MEKILGKDQVASLRWYRTGLDRCRLVARVDTVAGDPVGTGFLLYGRDLHPSLGEELLFLTCAHVVSDDPKLKRLLRPEDVSLTFEALETSAGSETYRIAEILWSSPPEQLDVTIARLEPKITGFEPYPIARGLPPISGDQKVYLLGHSGGRSLSVSISDNLLLDWEEPLLHYRAPTGPGSAGSPIFDAQWRLIGIHHAGSPNLRRLHGKPGTYAANEGIWIQSILRQLATEIHSVT
jgi:hypothetical protein